MIDSLDKSLPATSPAAEPSAAKRSRSATIELHLSQPKVY